MSRAKQAVARLGEEPDVVTGEGALAAGAPPGQASAGWKVLPIVEGLVLLIALVMIATQTRKVAKTNPADVLKVE